MPHPTAQRDAEVNLGSAAPPPSSDPNNQDLLVWALYELGGADRLVDVEEIYLECFRLAPARLGWRTRPDLPDYKKCAKALQSVEASTHQGLLTKLGRYERKLTAAGVEWCERWREQLVAAYGGEAVVRAGRASDQERTLRELGAHPAFQYWSQERALPSGWWDVADAFRCSPASSDPVWDQRLDHVQRAADSADDHEVREFVDVVRAAHHAQRGR
jgi:hypothetical protein